MADEQLKQQLLALPLPERVDLAQALWQSIDEEIDGDPEGEQEAVEVASRRDAELRSGVVVGGSHEEVIAAALRNRSRPRKR